MYQGASDHNAVVDDGGLKTSWRFDAGAKINGALAFAGRTLFVDTFNGDLIALDARTGGQMWRAHMGNVLMSTPVVYRGLVYVGSGRDGFLTSSATHRSVVSPVAGHLWGRPEGDEFAAFDAQTGALKWSYRTIGQDMPSPAISNGLLIFANGDGHAYALHASSGKLVWKRALHGISTMASANAAGGRVFISICDYVPHRNPPCETDALDARSGTTSWRAPYGNADAAPSYAGGRIFVSGLDRPTRYLGGRGIVAALDAQRGRLVWLYRTPTIGTLTAVGSGEVAVAGTYASGTYYQAIPTQDEFIAFDAGTGRVRWTRHSMGPIKMSAVLRGGKIYVGDIAGVFYVLDAQSGRLLNITLSREPFSVAPPLIAGDTLFFVNGSKVYAVPLANLPVRGGL